MTVFQIGDQVPFPVRSTVSYESRLDREMSLVFSGQQCAFAGMTILFPSPRDSRGVTVTVRGYYFAGQAEQIRSTS